MIFWYSATFNNLINAKSERILMKKNVAKQCQNVVNKILGKFRKFQGHIIILQKVIQKCSSGWTTWSPPSQNSVKCSLKTAKNAFRANKKTGIAIS